MKTLFSGLHEMFEGIRGISSTEWAWAAVAVALLAGAGFLGITLAWGATL